MKDVLVFDYDGTLTLDNGLFPSITRNVLGQVKKQDLALLGIVSGRRLEFLSEVNNDLGGIFAFLVAENGAVAYFGDTSEKTIKGSDWTIKARSHFSKVDFPIVFFEIIASAKREYSDLVSDTLHKSGLDARIEANKDSIMVMPPYVDKGSGVSSAIEHYGRTSGIKVTCFGDGENDLALFGPADCRVAVANSVPALKRVADQVTSAPGGLGVADYIRQIYSSKLKEL